MAFYCDDCLYIYDAKKISCPFCGRRMCDDNTPETELLNEGYTRRSILSKEQTAATQQQSAPTFHIDDNDILGRLRSSYEAEHNQAGTAGSSSSGTRTADTRTSNAGTTREAPRPQTPPATETTEQNTTNFFAQFATPQPPQQQVVVPTAPQQTVAQVKEQEENYNRELRALARERRRLERSYRRGEFFHALLHFNWRTLFRVLFVLAIVAAIIFVWNMRYVILNSILDFLISLVPIILVIAIFWNLIKSLFKGD